MQSELFKVLIPILIIVAILAIIAGILEMIGMWKIFKKAGKKGWEAIIPYYNIWTLNKISGCKWWFFLLAISTTIISFSGTAVEDIANLDFIASIANIFAMYMINYNIAKKFSKSHGYAIGMTLLPFIFYLILGFGKDKFDNKIKVSPFGVINEGV